MSDLMSFVEDRLVEEGLPTEVLQAYEHILRITRQMRRAGADGDLMSWITGTSALVKAGEYVFGADAETEAARFSDQLLAALAATWSDHPDYRSRWAELLVAK
ncbi:MULTISPECIES: hypothetical protein [Brevibacterium]|uniref:Uncharacterized protein n=2 Tax=Brevibacterium linens TaxID=1703 RepID=A0A2H1ICQ0_BRELN|nr:MULTISPECIES: hypothetical protein [Brevibacterium]MDN5586431.1 hypothetical protein [Brevibacterium sp.]MDN5604339.1 hypothetical protein [Kocuria sp.]KAB1946372.1 hypothetical protein F8227_12775 [Brevibacterium linens ATCC 9172]SMX72886.1 hypothetical protein BLIN101_01028 [Brevibacterium linens]SMX95241.1 hypothetical protein BLIN9172_02851 [Brevibacterium linens ATCC 9172]